MVNKNILKIRKKLDQLDNYFLNLVKKRTLLVDKVLKNKKYKKDIVDKKRIKIILKNINEIVIISYCILILILIEIILSMLNIFLI